MQAKFPKKMLISLGTGLIFWVIAGYLLPLWLPFLLGIGLAAAAEPTARLLKDRAHFPQSAASTLSVSAVWLLAIAVIGLVLALLTRQLQQLSGLLPRIQELITAGLEAWKGLLLSLAGRLPTPMGKALAEFAESSFTDTTSVLRSAMEKFPQLAGILLGGLSKGILILVTAIISAYMFSARLPKIRTWLRQRIPEPWRQRYRPLLQATKKALAGWLKAEAALATVTFLLLMAGFWLLRVDNAPTLAGWITLVDAFPVLGVGTVLLPWSVLILLQGDLALGVGLLGLFAVIWLIRSVLEPKLVGKGIGMDPLLTLAAIYVGFRLWGVAGMLLSPILALPAVQSAKQLQH